MDILDTEWFAEFEKRIYSNFTGWKPISLSANYSNMCI